jgi:hypothetical protein
MGSGAGQALLTARLRAFSHAPRHSRERLERIRAAVWTVSARGFQVLSVVEGRSPGKLDTSFLVRGFEAVADRQELVPFSQRTGNAAAPGSINYIIPHKEPSEQGKVPFSPRASGLMWLPGA